MLIFDELLAAGLDHVRLFGFDSFAGLPYDEEGEWAEGAFIANRQEVIRSLEIHDVDWNRVT